MEKELKKRTPFSSKLLAEETKKGGIEKRLARYDLAKRRTEAVRSHINNLINTGVSSGSPSSSIRSLRWLSRQLADCGSFLLFRHFIQLDLYRLRGGCTCKRHLLCVLCAIRRAAKYLASYKQKVEQVLKERPDLNLCMITLTVKNGDDLGERYHHLQASLKRLIENRRKLRAGSRAAYTVFSMVEGAVYAMETTNNGQGWHPHCHMLALVPHGVDLGEMKETAPGHHDLVRWGDFQKSLIDEWEAITGDSKIVDVRPVYGKESAEESFYEVFKYALKLGDMTVERQWEAYEVLGGKRLIGSLGLLRGVEIPEDLNDEIEAELELEPFVDLLYVWHERNGYKKLD